MTDSPGSTLSLILWPSVITLLVSVGRLVGEANDWAPTKAGGSGFWFGITWLGFLLGIWFAFRLRGEGSSPRVRLPWLWTLLSLLPLVAAAAWRMPITAELEQNEAGLDALRTTAITFACAASIAAAVNFFVWRRLAWTLFAYAIPARLTVIVLTWIAKHFDIPSHYTKFGPKGFVRDMEGTVVSATIMQLGFWAPITIVFGTLLGGLFFGRKPKG